MVPLTNWRLKDLALSMEAAGCQIGACTQNYTLSEKAPEGVTTSEWRVTKLQQRVTRQCHPILVSRSVRSDISIIRPPAVRLVGVPLSR